MSTRIALTHLSGSRAHRTENFPLDGTSQISFGRDPACTVSYDPEQDDVVSRQHAVLSVSGGDRPVFTLSDAGSRNGTFVNGMRLAGPQALLPGDTIEFGTGGPRLGFDVLPHPANGATRSGARPGATGSAPPGR